MVDHPAMAPDSAVRGAGGARRIAWLHDCFYSPAAGRIGTPGVARAMEPSANAPRPAIHRVLSHSARADNSYGFDVARDRRGSSVATRKFRTGNWVSLWLKHSGRCSRRGAGGN